MRRKPRYTGAFPLSKPQDEYNNERDQDEVEYH